MLRRIIIFIAVVAVLAALAAIAYFSFRSAFNLNVEKVVITTEAKFDPQDIEIKNDERLKIHNTDDKIHVVNTTGSDTPLVSLEPNEISKEIKFSKDSTVSIYLSDNPDEKMSIVVGTPETEGSASIKGGEETSESGGSTTTTTTTNTDTNNTGTSTTSPAPTTTESEPLPDTGSEDYIFPIVAAAGMLLVFVSRKLIAR